MNLSRTLSSIISKTDAAFVAAGDFIARIPLFLKILIVMTIFVIPVPLRFLSDADLYRNVAYAAPTFAMPIVNNLLLVAHIAFAFPALLIGPFLLWRELLKKKHGLHRTLGQIYVFCCIGSALTVIPLALNNDTSIPAGNLGFTMMGTIWFLTSYFAYSAAVSRDFEAHRRWAVRSYAMTFAFVHVNFTYKSFIPLHEIMSVESLKIMQSMVSWMFNLLVAEIYLAATTFSGKFVGRERWLANLTHVSALDRFHFRLRPLAAS